MHSRTLNVKKYGYIFGCAIKGSGLKRVCINLRISGGFFLQKVVKQDIPSPLKLAFFKIHQLILNRILNVTKTIYALWIPHCFY